MAETDNILEILLRLVRGERATPFTQAAPAISPPSVAGPLRAALSPGSPHSAQQTHVSLAVLAVWRMTIEYALKALQEKGRTEAEEGAWERSSGAYLHIYCIRAWTAFSRNGRLRRRVADECVLIASQRLSLFASILHYTLVVSPSLVSFYCLVCL